MLRHKNQSEELQKDWLPCWTLFPQQRHQQVLRFEHEP